jgi:hypothetical protein
MGDTSIRECVPLMRRPRVRIWLQKTLRIGGRRGARQPRLRARARSQGVNGVEQRGRCDLLDTLDLIGGLSWPRI